jgi:hypothetical protein
VVTNGKYAYTDASSRTLADRISSGWINSAAHGEAAHAPNIVRRISGPGCARNRSHSEIRATVAFLALRDGGPKDLRTSEYSDHEGGGLAQTEHQLTFLSTVLRQLDHD